MQTKDRSLAEAIFNALVSVVVYGSTVVVLLALGVNIYWQGLGLFLVAVLKNYTIRRVANLGEQDG
ncbi:hypothetical protein LCGC14_0808360 [marine sediment metagenome]|uniref:Uncharacterized protein n=1 Tax=marine sediment metagenome TaxID=412755 RepID=A0A0F9PS21_9ZZZZ